MLERALLRLSGDAEAADIHDFNGRPEPFVPLQVLGMGKARRPNSCALRFVWILAFTGHRAKSREGGM
jgi:hypothetical protein